MGHILSRFQMWSCPQVGMRKLRRFDLLRPLVFQAANPIVFGRIRILSWLANGLRKILGRIPCLMDLIHCCGFHGMCKDGARITIHF